ncbi:hypothetical protein B0H14DRAFT_2378290, partial [Mycena olivaceomarginata]
LPCNVIEEIFMSCLPTHQNCVMNATEAHVLLGRVYSAWRTILLSTPRLWSKLHVVKLKSPWCTYQMSEAQAQKLSEKVAQRMEATKMWLDRSGPCPLSISLHGA